MLVDPSYFLTGVSNLTYYWGCNRCHLTVIIEVKTLSTGNLHKACSCEKWPILGGQLVGVTPILG